MGSKMILTPAEISESTANNALAKTELPIWKLLLLGVLAGTYIAFAAFSSNMAAFNLLSNQNSYGLGRVIAGCIFAGGLVMVVLCGAELFTGNVLMLTGVLDGRVRLTAMLKNWLFVYIGNFIGSVFVAWLIANSGLLDSSAGLLGALTVKIAAGKIALTYGNALTLGILCNWLVCLAVWAATGARDTTGKVLAIFFPICMFVTSGFEHSVANMFYIPVGIFAKANYAEAAISIGMSRSVLDDLGWSSFLFANLLPVTIGNIIGGSVFVAFVYWIVYSKNRDKEVT